MFSSSDAYGSAFDSGTWKPYGLPDAVQSDAGFDGFVKEPLEAYKDEMRFAGDAMDALTMTKNAWRNAETDKEITEMYKDQAGGGSGGGGGMGSSIGGTLGSIAGNAIAPGIGGPIGSALGSAVGGLFG